jgi:hypothetical protein
VSVEPLVQPQASPVVEVRMVTRDSGGAPIAVGWIVGAALGVALGLGIGFVLKRGSRA